MNINEAFSKKNNLPLFDGKPEVEPSGAYLGTVDVRQEFVLTCTDVIPLLEGYAVKIYKFVDDAGNVVMNFASREGAWFPGEKYKIRATVKRHAIYAGVRQTHIIRLKTLELFYEKPAEEQGADAAWAAI